MATANVKDIANYEALYAKQNPNQNSTTMSSVMAEQIKNLNYDARTGARDVKDMKNFYNFDEDTPMKFRIYLFRQQFKEFSTLKQDQCIKLIQLYDKRQELEQVPRA